jgi:ureidoacrylate peracid hydrolase
MADFPIIPSKTGMIFFDTLNIYLHPTDPARAAQVKESGVVERMKKMGDACRAAGIAIFFPAADHRADHKDFSPQIVDAGYQGSPTGKPFVAGPPPVHAGDGSADVISELSPSPADYMVKKHRWSSFFQTHLELSLRTAGIDTLMIAGGAIEIGVASTAYAARDLDFNLIILKDICTASRPNVPKVFMEEVFPIFARVMTVDEAIALIQK